MALGSPPPLRNYGDLFQRQLWDAGEPSPDWQYDDHPIPPPPPTPKETRDTVGPLKPVILTCGTGQPTTGKKDDQSKTPWRYMDGLWGVLGQVVRVLEYGCKKYQSNGNWKLVENGKQRYLDASLRHQIAYRDGERLDPETGINHLAHSICSQLFSLWFDEQENK